METLHAGVEGVSSYCDGHWLAGVDQSARFTLLLVLHRDHINLLFILIFVIIII